MYLPQGTGSHAGLRRPALGQLLHVASCQHSRWYESHHDEDENASISTSRSSRSCPKEKVVQRTMHLHEAVPVETSREVLHEAVPVEIRREVLHEAVPVESRTVCVFLLYVQR